LLCCVGLHCSMYKDSYNVSYLNWPPPPLPFITLPHSFFKLLLS
jgi:hypothetical protein